jgi:valyl-tRNA synthetase
VGELDPHSGDAAVMAVASEVLTVVRRAKSDARVSMRAEVETLEVVADDATLRRVEQAELDLIEAARSTAISYREGEAFEVRVELAPSPGG